MTPTQLSSALRNRLSQEQGSLVSGLFTESFRLLKGAEGASISVVQSVLQNAISECKSRLQEVSQLGHHVLRASLLSGSLLAFLPPGAQQNADSAEEETPFSWLGKRGCFKERGSELPEEMPAYLLAVIATQIKWAFDSSGPHSPPQAISRDDGHHGSLLSRIVAVKPLERTESPSCLSGSAALNAAGTEVDPAGEQGGNVLPVFPVLNDKLRATNIAKAE